MSNPYADDFPRAGSAHPDAGAAMIDRVTRLASQAGEKQQVIASGTSWLYWVAALSLINSILVQANVDWSFALGTTVSLYVDAIAMNIKQGGQAGNTPALIAVAVNAVLAAIVAGAGWIASQGNRIVIGLAMLIYLLDGALLLTLPMAFIILPLVFHALVLWNLWRAFQAAGELAAIEEEVAMLAWSLPAPTVVPETGR
jgi:hypothetical protein